MKLSTPQGIEISMRRTIDQQMLFSKKKEDRMQIVKKGQTPTEVVITREKAKKKFKKDCFMKRLCDEEPLGRLIKHEQFPSYPIHLAGWPGAASWC